MPEANDLMKLAVSMTGTGHKICQNFVALASGQRHVGRSDLLFQRTSVR
jgi:hypothetical protein